MIRLLLAASFVTLLAAPALAQDGGQAFSGYVAGVTDYSNRGISRSDGLALQGQAQLNHPSGLYGGVGASTIDMNVDNDADIEAVLFGGVKGDFDGIQYNGKISYSGYPGADNDDLDYWELNIEAGYDFDVFYASVNWAVSPNYINDSGMTFYYGGNIALPLDFVGLDLTAKGHLGFMFLDDENKWAEDYADWSLGLWYNWKDYDVDFGLQFIDTSLNGNECATECGGRGVFTVSKDFGW